MTDQPSTTTATVQPPYVPQARETLHEWVQTDSLRKHCEAVAACMGYFARQQGADEDLWVAVGLLHDLDFERHPEMDAGEAGHPYVGVRYLRDQGWSDEITRAVLTHADYTGVEPVSDMEKTLRAVDELSGFVTAVALVRPDRSVHTVQVSSVKKKMKDKAFAAKVSRDDIRNGAELLGRPLEDVIQDVIDALKGASDRLGLSGIAAPTA
ncbi:MAG TPA: HDIG domain-containing protein [Thermomicrobiales bacterium]|nr:HDIG domain-containing protein [Thermomicrobiales bacterium]